MVNMKLIFACADRNHENPNQFKIKLLYGGDEAAEKRLNALASAEAGRCNRCGAPQRVWPFDAQIL